METNGIDVSYRRCAKCLSPIPEPDWVVNKVMAYCADCASLLHLGESKESRIFNEGGPLPGLPGPDSPPRPVEVVEEEDGSEEFTA